MTAAHRPNPMFGPNAFKLGVFRMNAEGGLAITRKEGRWPADWAGIAEASRIADRAGLEFNLPLARWKGYGGTHDNAAKSYETLTQAAALAAITEHACIFCTVHVALIHPVFAAKAVSTIDHVSGGRAGLNIVCGWNRDEFDMFGVPLPEHGSRYEQGLEWFEIFGRLVRGERFDHAGAHYRLHDAYSDPPTVQQPGPVIMSAGGSPAGRAFAAHAADFLFAVVRDGDHAAAVVEEIAADATTRGRFAGICAITHVVCRETEAEARDFYDDYALRQADDEAVDRWTGAKAATSQSAPADVMAARQRVAGGHGSFPLVGTPEQVAEGLIALHGAGVSGASLSFLDFRKELPFFIERVLPLLERAGLREPFRPG